MKVYIGIPKLWYIPNTRYIYRVSCIYRSFGMLRYAADSDMGFRDTNTMPKTLKIRYTKIFDFFDFFFDTVSSLFWNFGIFFSTPSCA